MGIPSPFLQRLRIRLYTDISEPSPVSPRSRGSESGSSTAVLWCANVPDVSSRFLEHLTHLRDLNISFRSIPLVDTYAVRPKIYLSALDLNFRLLMVDSENRSTKRSVKVPNDHEPLAVAVDRLGKCGVSPGIR